MLKRTARPTSAFVTAGLTIILLLFCGTAHASWLTKQLDHVVQQGGQLLKNTTETVLRAPVKTVTSVFSATAKGVTYIGKHLGGPGGNAVAHVGSQAEYSSDNVDRADKEAIRDLGDVAQKALQDNGNTTAKALHDVGGAAGAIGRYINRQALDLPKGYESSVDKIAQGKVIDGLWELEMVPYRTSNKNAGKAIRESPLLNTLGQIGATAYGGPAGAAAYAAWSTYQVTRNYNLALRAGIITGATSAAFQGAKIPGVGKVSGVNQMPADTASEITRKAVIAGALGGLAVAAMHGDKKDIQKGFLEGAVMVLVQTGYQKFTTKNLNVKKLTATRGGYCMMSDTGPCAPPRYVLVIDARTGKVIYGDPTKFRSNDPVANYVGVQIDKNTTSGLKFWVSERSPFMEAVGEHVPAANAGALLHDKLIVTFQAAGASGVPLATASLSTIAPMMIITGVGSGSRVYATIQDEAVEREKEIAEEKLTQKKIAQHTQSSSRAMATKSYTVADCLRPNNPKPTVKVSVDFPAPQTSPYVCRVVEEKGKDISYPWRALHDATDCGKRSMDLTARLMSKGWACLTPGYGNNVVHLARR